MTSKPCPATPPTPRCPPPTSRCGGSFARSATPANWPTAKPPEELFAHGGLYAEFGKVVCISVGLFHHLADGTLGFRTKSFAHDDECEVLRGFADLLGTRRPYGSRLHGATTTVRDRDKVDHCNDPFFLCAHNGREFD